MSADSIRAPVSSGSRSLSRRISAPRVLDLLIPLLVVLMLMAPALFTSSGFVDDWVNHLWLTWLQSREISATGHPSLFLNAEPLGVFYPNFAFYGGTLYAIGGYLMVITGAPVAVFVAMIVLSLAVCYGGTFWIARQAGIRGLAAHLPATIVVTGAYYLSLAYGRGSWPELVSTSMIPLVLALALRIARRGPTPGLVLGLGAVTAIWSGSHNLSFAVGTVFLAALTVCLLLVFGSLLTVRHVRWIGVAFAAIGFGVMINAWFLWPDVAFSLHTDAAQWDQSLDPAISGLFSRLSIVFDPLRARATDSSYLRAHFTELPVLVIIWLIAAAAFTWRGWTRRGRWLFGLLTIPFAVLLVLLLDESAWQKLPAKLSVIQFTFRLETYIVAMIAALTIVTLTGVARRGGRRVSALYASLVAIVLVGLGLGTWQVWNSHAYYYSPHDIANRSRVLRFPHHTPPSWYDPGQFRDAGDLVVPTDGSVRLNPAAIKGESTTQTVSIPPGNGPLASNIAASANLVSVHGLRVAGRTEAGFLALERPPDARSTATVVVQRADSPPLRYGPWLSLIGALGLICAAVACAVTSRRRHSGGARPAVN